MATLSRKALTAAGCLLTAVLTGCSSQPPTIPAAPAGPLPGPQLRAAAFGSMCPQIPTRATGGGFDALSTQPVSEATLASSFTQKFAFALQHTQLRDTVDHMHAITVFAPYDSAFDRFNKEQGQLSSDASTANPGVMTRLLRNHIVDGRYDRAGLLAAGTVHTLDGGQLRIVDSGQTIKITDSTGQSAYVLCGNIQTANANLYLIDHVLFPTGSAMPAGRP